MTLCVEVRRGPGRWVRAETYVPRKTSADDDPPLVAKPWYSGINYPLFQILGGLFKDDWSAPDGDAVDVADIVARAANVYPEAVAPIVAPRGLPDDLTYETLAQASKYGAGYDTSWLTARELIETDWYSNTIRMRGWVSPTEFWRCTRYGTPPMEWSTYPPIQDDIQLLTPHDMITEISNGNIATPWTRTGVKPTPAFTVVEWERSWSSVASDFVAAVVPRLARTALLDGGGLDNARIVYWFDG